ncbi:hypothetical protein PROFUN_12950 [Planoprotostelium fungivorum]|uniref:Uncharacterized protein n=1 Tax=Planoprotostelium fungivorum TaxID=1890364 RepID=A0A2P6N5X0_9EUKA|nr:hypothetical protein PROFUN_12950 [Planoprotostelium fungivorum]
MRAKVSDCHSGDEICTSCGLVLDTIISLDAEWRNFSEDGTSSSKARAEKNSSIIPGCLTQYSRHDADSQEFVRTGLRDIDSTLDQLYHTDCNGTQIHHRAREIFLGAYRTQQRQKMGLGNLMSNGGIRKKHSKKMQLVATSIVKALEESNIKTFPLVTITQLLADRPNQSLISRHTIQECIKTEMTETCILLYTSRGYIVAVDDHLESQPHTDTPPNSWFVLTGQSQLMSVTNEKFVWIDEDGNITLSNEMGTTFELNASGPRVTLRANGRYIGVNEREDVTMVDQKQELFHQKRANEIMRLPLRGPSLYKKSQHPDSNQEPIDYSDRYSLPRYQLRHVSMNDEDPPR